MAITRFSRLFAELRKRTGLVVRDVAERAGLRFHRCNAISCGRAVPKEHEVAQILGAFPLTAVEFDAYASAIDPTNETTVEVARRLRLQRATTGDPSAVFEHARLRIDYLSVTANLRKRAPRALGWLADALHTEGLEPLTKDQKGDFVDGWHRRMARFYRRVYRGEGIDFCFAPTKQRKRKGKRKGNLRRFARIAIFEFTSTALSIAARLFKLLDLSDHRVTRIDVAIDVDAVFGALHLLPPTKPATKPPFEHITHITAYGYESESQRRHDSLRLKVYDWTAAHGGAKPITRFEAEMKPRHLTLAALASLNNPFRHMIVAALSAAARDAVYPDSLIVADIAFYGATDRLLRLGVRHRARIRALLRREEPKPQPSQVFRRGWERELRRVLRHLGLSEYARV